MDKEFKLANVVLIGRTFDEYYKLLALDDIDPGAERILDVASGVSSFCAEANSKKYNVIASDNIYEQDPRQIERKCNHDLDNILKQVSEVADLYVWKYFKDLQALEKQRRRAYKLFLQDFREFGKRRYVPVEYPITPFHDKQFTISLSSGFLFLYDKLLDYDFHKRTIIELARITTREIRIWPVVNMKGKRSTFVERLTSDDNFKHCDIFIKKVDYEFFKNATEVMIIKR